MDNLLSLPKQLLTTERKIIKAVALLNLQGELIEKAGNISNNRLLVVAGRLINSHQGFNSELGWLEEPCQVWAKSSSSEYIVLSKIQPLTYLFVLTNPCLKGKIQSILDTVEQKFPTTRKGEFLAQCQEDLSKVIGPMARILVQNNADLYEDSPEKFLASLEQDLHKSLNDPHQVNLLKQQIKENYRSRRQS